MAPAQRRNAADLVQQLERQPERFDFTAAVRVLERAMRAATGQTGAVGGPLPPQQECVRFRGSVGLGFPAAQVSRLHGPRPRAGARPDLVENVFGLTGVVGAAPLHLTRQLTENDRRRDRAAAEFFDLFGHRLTSLFYRACVRVDAAASSDAQQPENASATAHTYPLVLFALAGVATPGCRDLLDFDPRWMLWFVGAFGRRVRSAASLASAVASIWGVGAEVLSYRGDWLPIPPNAQTVIGGGGAFNQLGRSAIAGERVWDVESKFAVRLGPLNYADFLRLSPLGPELPPLRQFVRTFVGSTMEFDVQLTLRGDEVPPCRLGGEAPGSRLGWNAWLHSAAFPSTISDAVFHGDSQAA